MTAASAVMRLSDLLDYIDFCERLGLTVDRPEDLRAAVDWRLVEDIINLALRTLRGTTIANMLFSMRWWCIVCCRFRPPELYTAVRKLRREYLPIVRRSLPELQGQAVEFAEKLAADVPTFGLLKRGQALALRDAAQIAYAAMVGPRRGEAALMLVRQVDRETETPEAWIAARASKMNNGRSPPHAEKVGKLLTRWIDQGWPVIGGRPANPTDPLWLKSSGKPADGTELAANMRRRTRDIADGGLSYNDLRRSRASQPDLKDYEVAPSIGDSSGSQVGVQVYLKRDRAAARRDLSEITTSLPFYGKTLSRRGHK